MRKLLLILSLLGLLIGIRHSPKVETPAISIRRPSR